MLKRTINEPFDTLMVEKVVTDKIFQILYISKIKLMLQGSDKVSVNIIFVRRMFKT